MVTVLTQELLSRTLGTPLPPLGRDLLFVPLAALASFNNPACETLWEAANRICDRYLPQLKETDYALTRLL